MAADLTTQLSLCRARKVRAETAVGDAEVSYQTSLRGGDDAQVEKAIRALDDARRGFALETDREASLQSALAEEARQAERAAEAAAWRQTQGQLAKANKLASTIESEIDGVAAKFAELLDTLNTLPRLHVDGRPDINRAPSTAQEGIVASLVRHGIADWVIPNSAYMYNSAVDPSLPDAVKAIGTKLAAQRAEVVAKGAV
jgi:hypothetical protein